MKIIRRPLIWCRNIFFSLLVFSIALVVAYKYIPVYYTPLMFIRLTESDGAHIRHQWVPVELISQSVVQAVVASEDNLFMEHRGFDHNQIRKATEEARKGRRLRGASTISQQTAKNVFLWPGRSYFRKGLEAYFTVLIEWIWGKERIMEVYLNSIEMGEGIYGIEAASSTYFGKPAVELTRSESALIAAGLPAPQKRNPAHPSVYMQGRQRDILSLMRKIETVNIGHRRSSKIN
jgi:monofunctional biosynthetic peptidoglycan transglycosylase